MLLKISCPHCSKSFRISLREAYRGNLVACPHCAGEQTIGGQVLAEIFWSFNHRPPAE
jgi:hypothetical protein